MGWTRFLESSTNVLTSSGSLSFFHEGFTRQTQNPIHSPSTPPVPGEGPKSQGHHPHTQYGLSRGFCMSGSYSDSPIQVSFSIFTDMRRASDFDLGAHSARKNVESKEVPWGLRYRDWGLRVSVQAGTHA